MYITLFIFINERLYCCVLIQVFGLSLVFFIFVFKGLFLYVYALLE